VKRPTLKREVVGFLVIGVIATIIHAGVGLAVNSFLKVAPLTANVIGYTSAFTFSYFGNSTATFGRSARDWNQFARFMTVSLAMFGLNEAIVAIFTTLAHWPYRYALIPALTVVPVVSFVVSKLWAFQRPFGEADPA
jgi:putative flippase GtrA